MEVLLTQVENHLQNLPDEAFFSALRAKEYSRLDNGQHIYLDYTGGNLYAQSQLQKHFDFLQNNVFGNPHSSNPTSQLASKYVDETRQKVLDFFNAEDYVCVFTQNASGALKIIGESYPFCDKTLMLILSDNHNSVNGIREFCKKKSGTVKYIPVQYEDLQLSEETIANALRENYDASKKLFAFPAQSNVTGVKHNLKWIKAAQEQGFDVLLDAAAFVPTNRLDLKEVQPDFVSVSFYKIFGYPTGIGCLLIKKSSYSKLQKPWFAGGTVSMVSVQNQKHFLAQGHERFEDGTLNYLEIPAIKTGLEFIEEIGIERINHRVKALISALAEELKKLKHNNGRSVVKIFGPEDFENHGGTIILNFFDSNGKKYPIEYIQEIADEQMISLRSGCFCNPGIDEISNCITNEELAKYFESRDNGDYHDMVHFLGKMRGAIRISVGIATSMQDLERFVKLASLMKNKTLIDD